MDIHGWIDMDRYGLDLNMNMNRNEHPIRAPLDTYIYRAY